MQDLSKLLLDGDTAAIQCASDLGESALPLLDACSDHDEQDVRFLVVECLCALGTPGAGRRLLRFCEDASHEVQLEAIHGLLEGQPIAGMGHELLAIYERQGDGYLRRQLALALGRLEAAEAGSQLAAKLHQVDQASDGLIAALARQGDAKAQLRLAELLRAAHNERVVEVLQLFRYVARPDCAWLLLPLLQREDVAQTVGTLGGSVARRTCDLALDELIHLLAGELNIRAREDLSAYRPEELAQATALLRQRTPG